MQFEKKKWITCVEHVAPLHELLRPWCLLSFSMTKVRRLHHVHRVGDAYALTLLPYPEKFNKSITVSLLCFAFRQKSDIDGER